MTRTYRIRVDAGISDRLMNYLRNELPLIPAWGAGRYKAANFARGPNNNNYFDCELNFVLDGNEINLGDAYDPEDPADVDRYFSQYQNSLISEITTIQIVSELLSDTGEE